MMNKHMIVGLLVAASVLVGAAQPSHAQLELARADSSALKELNGNGPDTSGPGNVAGESRSEEVELKRQEIQRRIDERRALINDKLSGRRAEICEQKEANINQVLATRTDTAQAFFDKFKTIHERLVAFTADKQLTVEGASALTLIMEEKRDTAQATISTARDTTFECSNTSASVPGEVIRNLIAQEKYVLDEYRTAIKDYAEAVRAAAVAGTPADDDRIETEAQR